MKIGYFILKEEIGNNPRKQKLVDELEAAGFEIYEIKTKADVKPETDMEKSLFTVDELTGIIQACARMRPNGIMDLELKSFMKKFKDKKFAAKCNRDTILKGCSMLEMDVSEVAAICIDGMREHAAEIGLLGTGSSD